MGQEFLSVEEERELLRLMRTGGRVGMEAKERLVLNFEGLVKKYAIKFHVHDPAIEFDDLMQIGYEALVKALNNFDPERGTRVSTYVQPAIRWGIQKAFNQSGTIKGPINGWYQMSDEEWRENRRNRQAISMELPSSFESDTTIEEALIGDDDVEPQVLNRVVVEQVLKAAKLPPAWERVVMRVAHGIPNREAASIEGLSRGIFSSSIRKIRQSKTLAPILRDIAADMGINIDYLSK